ncbi:HTH_Tnp_Tc3_2 domain-containing protein [Trichonephila clavipes]|nr:HTH_Tnp_Tc3_2 domain-containing protein [Trichonephila clavipes]
MHTSSFNGVVPRSHCVCSRHVERLTTGRLPKHSVRSTGHPRVTTTNEDRYLAVSAKRNRRSTASDLFRQLSSATGTTVSSQTVYRRLGHIGLYAQWPVRCVPLTATHCRLRLTWSRVCLLDTATVVLCDVFRRV